MLVLSGSNSQTLYCPGLTFHSKLSRVGRLSEKVAETWGMKSLDPLTPGFMFPGKDTEMKGTMAETPAEPRSFSSSLLPIAASLSRTCTGPARSPAPTSRSKRNEGRKDERLAQWVDCFPL